MNKKTVPDLKELFKQASEIAEQVPENMQEAAFNRALDLLTGAAPTASQHDQVQPQKTTRNPKTAVDGKSPGSDSLVTQLLVDIDSTQHPGVTSGLKVLDRALMVLQIALTDHGVDGLTPSDISKILTEKFRVNTTTPAVSMAIAKETTLVNRIPQGNGYIYRIMGPGQEYLSHLGENEDSQSSPQRRKKTKRRAKKGETVAAGGDAAKSATKTRTKASGTRKPPTPGRVGPKAALLDLIEAGFFLEARTGPETQSHLEKKRGLNLGIDQIRLAMLRLVREQKLDRDENDEGKYEYKMANS